MDNETDDDPENIAVRGGDDCPTSELGGAEEEAKQRIESEHLDEVVEPLTEIFFGVRKKVGDESERRNHYEEENDGLTEGESEETD